ncbi:MULTISPECIES: hypothetical protein [unclassified Legionella]|uniref:hypothetical protein n=1 Tax=unclassified Legionella TaxID=2622702 RepID=UPI0010563412|nr:MULTISPECIES: hypothetical protein [unclassified Legionella]MDI9817625.1 hypothetical protein [Legionella sp. PL877]
MKYKIQSTPALDYMNQADYCDCQDIKLETPMFSEKAKLVYASKATSHTIRSKQDLESLSFLHNNSPGMMLIKIGGGIFHYFIIQKEYINNQSFFRIFQAYDQGYTLQDWLNNEREWNTPAKKQFGNGQWLDSEKIKDFIQNMERIISDKDSEAYFQNFGVREAIESDVFIVASTFAKHAYSKESISMEVIQEQNQSVATITPLGMNTNIYDENDHLAQDLGLIDNVNSLEHTFARYAEEAWEGMKNYLTRKGRFDKGGALIPYEPLNFDRTSNATLNKYFEWGQLGMVLREGQSASDAILTILSEEVDLEDCQWANDLYTYYAVLKIIGHEKFDRLFATKNDEEALLGALRFGFSESGHASEANFFYYRNPELIRSGSSIAFFSGKNLHHYSSAHAILIEDEKGTLRCLAFDLNFKPDYRDFANHLKRAALLESDRTKYGQMSEDELNQLILKEQRDINTRAYHAKEENRIFDVNFMALLLKTDIKDFPRIKRNINGYWTKWRSTQQLREEPVQFTQLPTSPSEANPEYEPEFVHGYSRDGKEYADIKNEVIDLFKNHLNKDPSYISLSRIDISAEKFNILKKFQNFLSEDGIELVSYHHNGIDSYVLYLSAHKKKLQPWVKSIEETIETIETQLHTKIVEEARIQGEQKNSLFSELREKSKDSNTPILEWTELLQKTLSSLYYADFGEFDELYEISLSFMKSKGLEPASFKTRNYRHLGDFKKALTEYVNNTVTTKKEDNRETIPSNQESTSQGITTGKEKINTPLDIGIDVSGTNINDQKPILGDTFKTQSMDEVRGNELKVASSTDKKVLFIGYDGTLTHISDMGGRTAGDSNTILRSKTQAFLRKCIQEGIQIVIVSKSDKATIERDLQTKQEHYEHDVLTKHELKKIAIYDNNKIESFSNTGDKGPLIQYLLTNHQSPYYHTKTAYFLDDDRCQLDNVKQFVANAGEIITENNRIKEWTNQYVPNLYFPHTQLNSKHEVNAGFERIFSESIRVTEALEKSKTGITFETQLGICLKNKLHAYLLIRQKQKNSESSFINFFRNIGRFSYNDKVSAAEKLLNYLNGDKTQLFEDKDIEALQEGRLSGIVNSMKNWMVALPSQFEEYETRCRQNWIATKNLLR